ncbi:MAG: phosphotransferase [Solirubrobacterales bacterium]
MRPLGRGTDHVAYLAEGDLVVRCVEGGDPAGVVREADVLAAVAEVSPLPVPKPVRVDPDGGCLAYERLPGTGAARGGARGEGRAGFER